MQHPAPDSDSDVCQIPSMVAGEPKEAQDWAAKRLPDLAKSISKAILSEAQTAMTETEPSFHAPYSWHLRKVLSAALARLRPASCHPAALRRACAVRLWHWH